MTELEAADMDFWQVCEDIGIAPDSYHFAKAYRKGLVKHQIWVQKYLVRDMMLVAAIDDLIDAVAGRS